jgi:predicted Co/Zn/Cd cation transporter (cation efflux family)
MEIEEFCKLVAACLIVFGISFAAAVTDGPFGIFDLIRTKIELRTKRQWIRSGISCPICIAFWVSMPISIALNGGWVMWLAAVGFVCVVISLSPDGSED